MTIIEIILFIVLCVLIIVEIIQYRLYIINVGIFDKAVAAFNKEAMKYQESFTEMAQAVEISTSVAQGVAGRQVDLQDEFDKMLSVIDVHSEALNLKLLEGILTTLKPK